MRQKLFDHIKKKYMVKPEYPWRKYPDYAVLRHSDNNKWFALVAEVERTKLGLSGDAYVPIVNLKVDDLMSTHWKRTVWKAKSCGLEKSHAGLHCLL